MKLFLDANVVFSAAHRAEGRAQALVALARAGRCLLVTSAHALEEARRNLELKSHGYDKRLAAALGAIAIVPEAPHELVAWARAQGLPLKDAPILAAAVHGGAHLLVTGDARDFGSLYGRALRGVTVVTPARALEAVLAAG
ncbi:MAG: PIN domain-containing protein [Betaproteobacteria bacterium]|nr:PIN domain-containing protein [Betaproteobacteria bacterium]